MFIDFKINDCENVPDLVERYIEFFNEERPAYALGYLTPKAYKEMYGPKNSKVSTKCWLVQVEISLAENGEIKKDSQLL